jgi:general secretion pathway protein N
MVMRAAALLIGLCWAGSAEAQVASVPPPAIPTADRASSANPLWAIPLGHLAATRERPLFSPSRRPPPPVVVAKAPPPPPPPPLKPAEPEKPPLTLIGTAVGETGEAIGLFTNLADLKGLRLKVGEEHKGWVLREVRQRQVVLEKGQQNAVLELPRRDVGRPGAVPPGAVPPPAFQPNRKSDAAGDEAATPASPDADPKVKGGFSPPSPAVAANAPQLPALNPPPPPPADSFPGGPLQRARLR